VPHVVHDPPPLPHVWFDVLLHTPLLQHPLHAPPPQLHAPAVHVCPVSHMPQALPPEPQAVAVSFASARHVAPWQHPFGHEPGVHVQTPAALHACPLPQVVHAAPPVPQMPCPWLA